MSLPTFPCIAWHSPIWRLHVHGEWQNDTLPLIKGFHCRAEVQNYSDTVTFNGWINDLHVTQPSLVKVNLARRWIKHPGHCMNDLVFSLSTDKLHRTKENFLLKSTGPVYQQFTYTNSTLSLLLRSQLLRSRIFAATFPYVSSNAYHYTLPKSVYFYSKEERDEWCQRFVVKCVFC